MKLTLLGDKEMLVNYKNIARIGSLCWLLFCLWSVPAFGIRVNHEALYSVVVNTLTCQVKCQEQINSIIARLNKLEGIPAQLTEAKNNIATLKTVTDTDRANTVKIKEETTTITTRVDATVASASEKVKLLEEELKQNKQALENYKNQAASKEEAQRRFEQRQWRFHRSLKELFIKGDVFEDTVMVDCFKRACEISPDFCTSYNELKKFHDNWNKFMEETSRFENLFQKLLEVDAKMQELIDQPIQPVITGEQSNDLLALEANPHNEL